MLLIAMLALSTFAHADVVQLDCNVEGGDQQVRVLDGAHGLRLEELTMAGTWKTRALTAQEWGERLGTISYEIVTGIGPRVPRISDAGHV